MPTGFVLLGQKRIIIIISTLPFRHHSRGTMDNVNSLSFLPAKFHYHVTHGQKRQMYTHQYFIILSRLSRVVLATWLSWLYQLITVLRRNWTMSPNHCRRWATGGLLCCNTDIADNWPLLLSCITHGEITVLGTNHACSITFTMLIHLSTRSSADANKPARSV